MDIKELVGQHKKSVALVFKRLGINAPVTQKEVVYATLVYQGDFIDAVENQIAADLGEYANYTGDNLPQFTFTPKSSVGAMMTQIGVQQPINTFPANGTQFGQTQTLPTVAVKSKAAKKSLWDILDTVAGAAGKFIAAKNAGKSQPSNVEPASPEDAAKKNKTTYMIIGVAVLLLVLLLIFFLTKGKK
jgi:hypothetical protein